MSSSSLARTHLPLFIWSVPGVSDGLLPAPPSLSVRAPRLRDDCFIRALSPLPAFLLDGFFACLFLSLVDFQALQRLPTFWSVFGGHFLLRLVSFYFRFTRWACGFLPLLRVRRFSAW